MGAIEEISTDKTEVAPGSAADLERFFKKAGCTEEEAFAAKELNWGWKDFGEEDGAALAYVIKEHQKCITLDLYVNELFPKAGALIGHALAHNRQLKTLDLQQGQIGVDGAKALSQSLKSHPSLMNLKLHYNHLGPEGIAYICEALKTNNTLTNFDVGDNGIMREGVKSLASMLETNVSLMRLEVSKNAGLWGDDESKAILTAAAALHQQAREQATQRIPQDALEFKLLMDDSPGQLWTPDGFVNVPKMTRARVVNRHKDDEPIVVT